MNNIISFTNAGKRRYGDNQWFWAVWVDVDDPPGHANTAFGRFDDWNETAPTESGFGASMTGARSSAFAAIRRHVGDRKQQRAYQTGWARQYLSHQREQDTRPSFSRCRIGKDKWLWVVFRDGAWFDDEEPVARGVAESAEAAYEAAVEAVGPVRQARNWMVNAVRKKEAAVKLSQQTTTTDDAAPLEFVYECHWYDSDYDHKRHDTITKHRIVKKTKKRVYVDSEPWPDVPRQQQGDWHDFRQSTFILDRQEFEETGKGRRSGCWYETYYADPAIYHAEQEENAFRPKFLTIFGLPADASVEDVQAAYRKMAFETHPDQGGNAKEFKRVREAYEAAMASAGCA